MRTSISMITLAVLSASYDYCQSLGHEPISTGWIMLLVVMWGLSFVLSLLRDYQKVMDV